MLCVSSLTRFGFKESLDSFGKPTQEYWDWYKWWKDWHNGMSDEEWNKVNLMLGKDMTPEQIAYCRPPGTWKKSSEPLISATDGVR